MASECFLCCHEATASTPLYRVCRCDTLVHQACFERLIQVDSHRNKCAVCKCEYTCQIVRNTTRRLVLATDQAVAVYVVTMLSTLMVCMGCIGINAEATKEEEYYTALTIILGVYAAALSLTMLTYRLTTGNCKLCHLQTVVLSTRVIMPQLNRNELHA